MVLVLTVEMSLMGKFTVGEKFLTRKDGMAAKNVKETEDDIK